MHNKIYRHTTCMQRSNKSDRVSNYYLKHHWSALDRLIGLTTYLFEKIYTIQNLAWESVKFLLLPFSFVIEEKL